MHAYTPDIESNPVDPDDLLGRLFQEYHRKGEDMGMRFGRLAPGAANAVPEWCFLPHWRYDGIGGFGHLLRERGVPGLARLPGMSRPGKLGVAHHTRALLRHVVRVSTPTVQRWRRVDEAWRPPARAPGRCANAVGYMVLSCEETQKIDTRARLIGVSTNSLLLWAVDQVAREMWLQEGWESTRWMVPVNLRDSVARTRDTANHIGLLDVELRRGVDVQKTHAEVKRELELGGHWGAWDAMKLGRFMPAKAIRAFVETEMMSRSVFTGLFSNLGVWGPPGPDRSVPESEAVWLFAPQATLTAPVSGGAVIWAGRLTLAMQAHPLFGVRDDDVAAWTQRWAHWSMGG